MPKQQLDQNVLEAARERIAFTFDEFEKIYVSFSGGKDSTVMLHLVADEARKRGRQIGVLFIDLEGQYRVTIEHNHAMFDEYADVIIPFWVCLPLHLRNAVSVYQPFWECWEPGKEDIWIRECPERAIANHDHFPFFVEGMEFEEFVPEFGEWFAQGEKTACFVGIRCDESINRFRSIATSRKDTYDGKQWTTKVSENAYNIYPVYDWNVADLWVYHCKFPEKRYNYIYELMHKAGLKPSQMRICQPYGDDQRKGLWLFHLIEPETWARVVARVNGANGGALYMQEWGNINGYRKIAKPNGHTWKTFAELLINSMPPAMCEHYQNKIVMFDKWWREKGYPDGIPDEAQFELEQARRAPSWRRVCKSLLRNDYWCKGLGFSQHKSAAYQKYLDLMKRRRAEWSAGIIEGEYGFGGVPE